MNKFYTDIHERVHSHVTLTSQSNCDTKKCSDNQNLHFDDADDDYLQ